MNKKVELRFLFFFFTGFLVILSLSAQSLDPVEYLEVSRAAVSLPRAISAYNDYIDEQNPVLYGIFDVDLTTKPNIIPSVDGPLNGRFIGIDGFFYARLFQVRDVSLRALILPSIFSFSMDSQTATDYNNIYGDETSMKWVSGYALLGFQARRGSDYITLGTLLRVEPLVDPVLNEFDRILSEDTAQTETTSVDRLYADFSLNGWQLSSMVSPEYLEQLAVEKLFALATLNLNVGPILEYLGRANFFRPGAGIEWKPVPWFEAAAQAKLKITGDSIGLGEADLQLDIRHPVLQNVSNTGKDMSLQLGLEASVYNSGGTLLPGGKAELSLNNYPFLTWFDFVGLKYLGTITLGVSWNHAVTLTRMPFQDQLIIYIRTGGGYYTPEN